MPPLFFWVITWELKGGFVFIIYTSKNIHTKQYYVGQTSRSLRARITSHYGSPTGYFGFALKSSREDDWVWEIVDSALSQEEAQEKEAFWIAKLKAFTKGYNSVHGTFMGNLSREKMSHAKKGKKPWNAGRKNVYTEEALQRMSLARMGKRPKINDETRARITKSIQESVGRKVTNLETNEVYPSVLECARRLNVSHTTVKKVLSGKSKSSIIKIEYYKP